MTNGRMSCYLSYRASRWLWTMTSDPDIRQALAEENLKRKVRAGNGFRVYFELTRIQAEHAIKLLAELETLRVADSLPDIGVGHDHVIFTNAIIDFQQCLTAT